MYFIDFVQVQETRSTHSDYYNLLLNYAWMISMTSSIINRIYFRLKFCLFFLCALIHWYVARPIGKLFHSSWNLVVFIFDMKFPVQNDKFIIIVLRTHFMRTFQPISSLNLIHLNLNFPPCFFLKKKKEIW